MIGEGKGAMTVAMVVEGSCMLGYGDDDEGGMTLEAESEKRDNGAIGCRCDALESFVIVWATAVAKTS